MTEPRSWNPVDNEETLIDLCREYGWVLYTDRDGKLYWTDLQDEAYDCGLYLATFPEERPRPVLEHPEGFGKLSEGTAVSRDPIIGIPSKLLSDLERSPSADFWKYTTRAWNRAFVCFDVSGFSKLDSALQLLIVTHLIVQATEVRKYAAPIEAELCTGDGYVYVFEAAVDATVFAARLAHQLEDAIADRSIPEFHFRIGVHIGEVRFFWDPGRKAHNYVGDGINDANRVLAAVGKDDAVFVSEAARLELRRTMTESASNPEAVGRARRLLVLLDNQGSYVDKHGKVHRVYQLNHSSNDARM